MQLFIADEAAHAVRYEGGTLTLRAVRAFAPGQPVTLRIAHDEQRTLELRGKSLGSRRETDGRFAVRVRLVNLRRSEREYLEQRFGHR